jgi:hypothetical protein
MVSTDGTKASRLYIKLKSFIPSRPLRPKIRNKRKPLSSTHQKPRNRFVHQLQEANFFNLKSPSVSPAAFEAENYIIVQRERTELKINAINLKINCSEVF